MTFFRITKAVLDLLTTPPFVIALALAMPVASLNGLYVVYAATLAEHALAAEHGDPFELADVRGVTASG